MGENRLGRDLTSGAVTPVLLRFAWPVMLSNLLQTAYGMIDMAVVGQVTGSAGLSAVSIGGDIMRFYLFVGMGFAVAGQIMVSQYIGAGRGDRISTVIGTLFSFTALLGVALAAISMLTADSLLTALHVPEAARAGARAYTLCCSAGMVFIFGYNMVSAVLRGMGDSRRPMFFIGLAALLNVALDLLFIAGWGLGALGAALATVLAQGLSLVLSLAFLYKNRARFGFDFAPRSFRIDAGVLATAVRLGIPVAVQESAGSLSWLFVGSFANGYGVAASAITGVGSKLESVALIVANALNTSGSAVIGQSFGAGRTDRVRLVVRRVFLFDLLFVGTLAVGILLFPGQVFSLFDASPEALSMAGRYAPVAALAFLGYAFRSPCLSLVNGLGLSRLSFLMGLVEGFVLRIGLTYLFGVLLGYGLPGFWYGSTIAGYGYAVVVAPYYFSGAWERRRPISA